MPAALIQKYFPELSKEQLERFSALPALYEEWNARINLISRQDMEQFMERHVLHSLAIAKVLVPNPNVRILDVGTGGGFPGIPLAIFYPGVEFTLVDSIGKKIRVVQAVAESLGLTNVRALQSRMEDVKGSYSYITHRAVKPMPMLMDWTSGLKRKGQDGNLPNGWVGLKGGDLSDELSGLKHRLFPVSGFFTEPFFETKSVVYLPF